MINLNSDICRQIREARRQAHLSQSELANEVGCKQSALSMFEQGGTKKLSEDVVVKLAQRFGINLESSDASETPADAVKTHVRAETSANAGRGFCPNPQCPTNSIYQVEERTFLLPDRAMADPVRGRFCARCGEVLERKCPNCAAPVHDGAVCSLCGEAYIAVN